MVEKIKRVRDTSLWKFVHTGRKRGVANFACVMTQAVLAKYVFDTPEGCVDKRSSYLLQARKVK